MGGLGCIPPPAMGNWSCVWPEPSRNAGLGASAFLGQRVKIAAVDAPLEPYNDRLIREWEPTHTAPALQIAGGLHVATPSVGGLGVPHGHATPAEGEAGRWEMCRLSRTMKQERAPGAETLASRRRAAAGWNRGGRH